MTFDLDLAGRLNDVLEERGDPDPWDSAISLAVLAQQAGFDFDTLSLFITDGSYRSMIHDEGDDS